MRHTLTARLARLEAQAHAVAERQVWLTIFRTAAEQVPLDAKATARLLAAIEAHHAALGVPAQEDEAQVVAYTDRLADGVLEAIVRHVPPAWQNLYRQLAADLCDAEARRRGWEPESAPE